MTYAPPRIVTREEAGLRVPKPGITRRPQSLLRGTVVHHEAAYHALDEDPVAIWRNVQAFHMGPSRGWSDISYNAGVAQDGTVLLGRDAAVMGAHTYQDGELVDWNRLYLGVVWLGHGDQQEVTDEAWNSILWYWQLVIWSTGANQPPATEFLTHRECVSTACPGRSLQARMDSFRLFISGLGSTLSAA